eukprot:4491673-Pyramimonas_sp.AAC.1
MASARRPGADRRTNWQPGRPRSIGRWRHLAPARRAGTARRTNRCAPAGQRRSIGRQRRQPASDASPPP